MSEIGANYNCETAEAPGPDTAAQGNRSLTVGLFLPPAYQLYFPPLATAALTGFLKARGVQAEQQDLNVLFSKYAQAHGLERTAGAGYVREKITGGVYYGKVLQYRGTHHDLLSLFRAIPPTTYAFTERLLSSRLLYRYIADRGENPFVGFFHQEVLSRVTGYDVVGFSIASPSQVMAAFTFGYWTKRNFPEAKVVIGGHWVSLFRDALKKKPRFNQFFDFAVFFEGETPLYRLTEALAGSIRLSAVPNLMRRTGGSWVINDEVRDETMDQLPPPDFEGLPLAAYTEKTHGLALTYETARGCYWNKCIFCQDYPLPRQRYREKSPAVVVSDIKHLIARYGVNHLVISNAALAPRQMREISRRLIEQAIKITWYAFVRMDKGFDREVLELAQKSGCVMLDFGLESINQRVLDFIKKGTHVEVIKRIIEDAKGLDLSVCLMFMMGLPSETREEAMETLAFILRQVRSSMEKGQAYIHPLVPNLYVLTPGTDVFATPERFGLRARKCRKLPFRYFHPFEHLTGTMDRSTTLKMIRLCAGALSNAPDAAVAGQRPDSELLSSGDHGTRTNLEGIRAGTGSVQDLPARVAQGRS